MTLQQNDDELGQLATTRLLFGALLTSRSTPTTPEGPDDAVSWAQDGLTPLPLAIALSVPSAATPIRPPCASRQVLGST